MMKNLIKFPAIFLSFGALLFIVSCGNDDGGGIIPLDDGDGGGFQVADGFYLASISGSDTTILNANILPAAKVEGDGFAPTDRDGHRAGYMYLTDGSYFFADIDDQQISAIIGGTASFVDSVNTAAGAYTYVTTAANGSAFTLGSGSGLYHVVYDDTEGEAYLIKITSWGIIGGGVYESVCVSNGFNEDVDLAEVSVTADGSSWSSSNIIIREGEYKFRYNDNWTIGSYKSFTNFGITDGAIIPGGGNINNTNEGLYTVTFEVDDDGVVSWELTETGEPEACAFDADNFPWGIIGGGTQGTMATAGWSDDKDLVYAGQSGATHTWRGVFPIAGGATDNQFKFRTDDTWATKLTTQNVNFTDNTEVGTITEDDNAGDGQWLVADGKSGFYYIEITTDDQGSTWNLTVDEAVFQLIGDGSPVASWTAGDGQNMTYNDDLASWTGNGAFTTDGWKFYVNQSFDYNLGGIIDGSTALLFNSDAATLSSANTYQVTLTTADGGVTYTATAVTP